MLERGIFESYTYSCFWQPFLCAHVRLHLCYPSMWYCVISSPLQVPHLPVELWQSRLVPLVSEWPGLLPLHWEIPLATGSPTLEEEAAVAVWMLMMATLTVTLWWGSPMERYTPYLLWAQHHLHLFYYPVHQWRPGLLLWVSQWMSCRFGDVS